MKRLFAVASLIACLAMVAKASDHMPPPLQVHTYLSPSAKWAVKIDPSERYGCGPATYSATQDGKTQWSKELPFTLCDAQVTDSGLIVGYAYSHGYEGFDKNNRATEPGTLSIAIIDSNGDVRLNDVIKRHHTNVLHGSPEPVAKGILVHPNDDRLTVRISTEQGEAWQVYQLSTGAKVKRFDMHPQGPPKTSARVLSAKALPDYPLTVVHWWCYDSSKGTAGAMFNLCDHDGRNVWSLVLPDDYRDTKGRLQAEIWNHGAILATASAGAFELRFAAANERVRFQATPNAYAPSGWTIKEVDRKKYQGSEPAPIDTPVSTTPLSFLGSFELQDRPQQTAIRDIREYAFTPNNDIGFLRREADLHTFVLVDQHAKMLSEIHLPMAKGAYLHLAWLTGNEWIVTSSDSGENGKTLAWRLDTEAGSIIPMTDFNCPAIEKICGAHDGGFVVLATVHQRYSSTAKLTRFDKTGKLIWSHDEKSGDSPASLFSPSSITVTDTDEIAVLDVIRHTVQLFDLKGTYLRAVDLAKAWGRNPRYPSDITFDIEGGYIVRDFNGDPSFIRMKADGTIRSQLRPKTAEGKEIESHTGLMAAPDGTLWACDGHSFLKLSDDGVVNSILGPSPNNDKLDKISGIAGDQKGNVYAADERTACIHVFDSQGNKLRVCKPAPSDFAGNVQWPHLAVANDGQLSFCQEQSLAAKTLLFDQEGRRKGMLDFKVDSISQQLNWLPGTSNLVVLGYESVFITTPAGEIITTINRRPDGQWISHPKTFAAHNDGSFAILSRPESETPVPPVVTLFSREGKALTTFPVRESYGQLRGFNGTHVSLGTDAEIHVYDVKGILVRSLPVADKTDRWDHFLTRDGKELWLLAFGSHTVRKYAMP